MNARLMLRSVGMVLMTTVFLNSLTAQNNQVMTTVTTTAGLVELTEFEIIEGVKEDAFLQAAEEMQKGFLDQQEGFIQRALVKGEHGKWTDVVFWTDQTALERAMQEANHSPAAARFMQMIDFASVQMKTGTVSLLQSKQ